MLLMTGRKGRGKLIRGGQITTVHEMFETTGEPY